MSSSDTAQAPETGEPDEEEQHRLTTLSGLAALSLDALSSVAYGPEAIVVVLVAAGTAGLAICRPHFQLATWSPPGQAVSAPPPVPSS